MRPKEVIESAGEDVLEDEIADLHAEIAQLRRELTKAQKDTERLNATETGIVKTIVTINGERSIRQTSVRDANDVLHTNRTLREAIDAAIKAAA